MIKARRSDPRSMIFLLRASLLFVAILPSIKSINASSFASSQSAKADISSVFGSVRFRIR